MARRADRAPRVLRKYANRRLYDAEQSKHVRLSEVRDLIAGGTDVRVIDDVSGEDITRSILVQLVAEQEVGGKPVLSDEMLVQIIRYYGHPIQGVLGAYLQQGLEIFLAQQRTLQDSMREMMKSSPLSLFEDLASRNLDALQSLRDTFLKPKGARGERRDDASESSDEAGEAPRSDRESNREPTDGTPNDR
jgi:polyhydroxyalkanoate synthesis repressor PhaR